MLAGLVAREREVEAGDRAVGLPGLDVGSEVEVVRGLAFAENEPVAAARAFA